MVIFHSAKLSFISNGILALGLLGSVNFVWMNREDPNQMDKDNATSNTKTSGLIGNGASSIATPTASRRRKKKRKE